MEYIKKAGASHTGRSLSCVDTLNVLYNRILNVSAESLADPARDRPVKLAGISAGVSYGALGATHHSTHDLAALRAIENITMIVPADNLEAAEAIPPLPWSTPVYLRFGKRPLPHLHLPQTQVAVGKARTVCEGKDVAFVTTGETVHPALMAAIELEAQGVSARVISMHTVKPLDTNTLIRAAGQCRAIITVEEHSIFGSLGEACAAVLMQAGMHVPFRIVGFPDEYMVTGSQLGIFEHYGITAQGLARTAKAMLGM